AYAQTQSLRDQLKALSQDAGHAEEQLNTARLDLSEIESANPQIGEDERLRERRRYLDNIEKITLALRTALEAITGDDASANAALGRAASALHAIREIGGELSAIAESAAAVQSDAGDLAVRIARELDSTEFDAAELEAITGRLDALDRIRRKYGGTLEAVVLHAEKLRAAIENFSNQDERLRELRRELELSGKRLAAAAQDLSQLRATAASQLQQRIASELAELAMPSASFEVLINRLAQVSSQGAEAIEFAFSANSGQPRRPLAKVASGGELSRVLLALIVVMSRVRERTTLIFDEIDTGIGGVTATAVTMRLKSLAKTTQLLCVTHLAQIASSADRHYVLTKREMPSETTVIEVIELGGNAARAQELARMLSGQTHDTALKHAALLLEESDAESSQPVLSSKVKRK
ncbi:MAG: hypothetical protein M3Y21_07960, partial [Candidatus Eremiobacteraeota bacterium]|nr:hypothetical protein [Candidatus Eremiobacteraeota bacterium]